MENMDFGDYIREKRLQKGITLRSMAALLKISPAFLSDVEKGRRNPFEKEKLDDLSKILALLPEERSEMMDLAGKKKNEVPPDLPEYIMEHQYVSMALRTARDLGAGEKEWKAFVEELKQRKGR